MRHTIAILSVLVATHSAFASVNNYTFNSATLNYTPIVGTVLWSGTWDDASSALLTIPFSFTYNNVPYTTVGVNTNGFI
ncbi:MAG TPA: hypothetical protein PK760_11290, partial [Flavobacteriales bacterium]|nr:hypothetical protein [Flavobacteriales bacterium]